MITPEFRKVWVDALRSGDFKQGNGFLCTGDAYCCLGVACEVHPGIRFDQYGGGDSDPLDNSLLVKPWKAVIDVAGNKCSGMLPENILNQIGLSDLAQSKLAGLNDQGKSFEYIADIIESGKIDQGYYPPIEI